MTYFSSKKILIDIGEKIFTFHGGIDSITPRKDDIQEIPFTSLLVSKKINLLIFFKVQRFFIFV